MALISPSDQQKLQESFAEMTRPVRLLFFTQTIGCETCLQTRQILDELPPLSDKISIEEVNPILDADIAKAYGIDRAPAIAVTFQEAAPDAGSPAVWKDSRIRFLGAPAGYEFISLVQACLLAGGRPSGLAEESRERIAAVNRPIAVKVFTTPTCPYCPRAVNLAHEMAFASANITAYAVEATEFPDLARRYNVTGVPKTVINDEVEIYGALPEDAFVEQALEKFSAGPAS
jgi:glutaredoxin-like protein